MDRDSPMTSALISLLLAGLPLLTGCAQPAAQAGGGGGGTIKAINHTKWAINHFSVNASPDHYTRSRRGRLSYVPPATRIRCALTGKPGWVHQRVSRDMKMRRSF